MVVTSATGRPRALSAADSARPASTHRSWGAVIRATRAQRKARSRAYRASAAGVPAGAVVPPARVPGQLQGTSATPASWASSSAGRQAAGFTGPTRPETRPSAEDTAPREPGVRHGSGSSVTSKRGPSSSAASRFRRAAARRAARSGRARAKMGSQAQGPSTPTVKTAERAEGGRRSSSSRSRSRGWGQGGAPGTPGGDRAHRAGAQSRGSGSPPARRAHALIAGFWEQKRGAMSGEAPRTLSGPSPQPPASQSPTNPGGHFHSPNSGLDDPPGVKGMAWKPTAPLTPNPCFPCFLFPSRLPLLSPRANRGQGRHAHSLRTPTWGRKDPGPGQGAFATHRKVRGAGPGPG